jgi:hypothetical protein
VSNVFPKGGALPWFPWQVTKQQADNRRTNDWGWKLAAVGLKTILSHQAGAGIASCMMLNPTS